MAQIRIGTSRVNLASRVIEGDAGRNSVEPKVLQVLEVLIQANGEVVSREDLIDQMWGVGFGGDERLSRAISLLRERDFPQFETAKTILETLTQVEPEFADGWATLATANVFTAERPYLPDGAAKMAAAREQIATALELEPNSPKVLSIAGLLAEEPEVAKKHLLQALEMVDGDAQSWFWLGHTQKKLGETSEAMESYARVASLDPLWSRNLFVSEFIASNGDVARAEAIDQSIVAASSENWRVLIANALKAKRAGQFAASVGEESLRA